MSDLCLAEVFLCAFKHKVCDTESEDFVCFFEKFFCYCIVVVEVFAHSDKLSPLSGEYECFHLVIFV